MVAFTSPESLREYYIASKCREPTSTEYWNAACDYMVERFTYAQRLKAEIDALEDLVLLKRLSSI